MEKKRVENKATIEYASRYPRWIHKFFSIAILGNGIERKLCSCGETVFVRSFARINGGKRHEFEYRRLRCALYERAGIASVTWLKVTRRTNAANIWPSVSTVPERERLDSMQFGSVIDKPRFKTAFPRISCAAIGTINHRELDSVRIVLIVLPAFQTGGK